MNDQQTRGLALKLLRLAVGHRPRTAALVVGVSERSIYLYENGTTIPDDDRLLSMLGAYGATLADHSRVCTMIRRVRGGSA